MTRPEDYDAIVLGAGGAGLMCAATAGQRGRRVLLVDHNAEPGRKILISGGGRCNFTNLNTPADRFVSANPHFAKSALARYTPQDFIALVERHGIAWHEKTLGQLFCDGSARQIVQMLRDECRRGGVTERYGSAVREIAHGDRGFTVRFEDCTSRAPRLVVATGGLSIPKIGATGFAYDVARRFGLEIATPRPGLVPLTLGPDDALFATLSGVATEVIARVGKAAFREAGLFTHKGLSGPAILQVSSYWRPGMAVHVNLVPDAGTGWLVSVKRDKPRASLAKALAMRLPARLAEAVASRVAIREELANVADIALQDAAQRLANWSFQPSGTEGFAKAEVTVGGVATSGLSSQTLEAKTVPGLHFIGEAVDVTGWLGGYNFQWAWSSGVAAGRSV